MQPHIFFSTDATPSIPPHAGPPCRGLLDSPEGGFPGRAAWRCDSLPPIAAGGIRRIDGPGEDAAAAACVRETGPLESIAAPFFVRSRETHWSSSAKIPDDTAR